MLSVLSHKAKKVQLCPYSEYKCEKCLLVVQALEGTAKMHPGALLQKLDDGQFLFDFSNVFYSYDIL